MAKMRVEMEQADWQTLIDLLQGTGPYRLVAPLIGKLAEQLNAIPAPGALAAKSDGVEAKDSQ